MLWTPRQRRSQWQGTAEPQLPSRGNIHHGNGRQNRHALQDSPSNAMHVAELGGTEGTNSSNPTEELTPTCHTGTLAVP